MATLQKGTTADTGDANTSVSVTPFKERVPISSEPDISSAFQERVHDHDQVGKPRCKDASPEQ